jgi:uncharacterized protein (DUF1697 family)
MAKTTKGTYHEDVPTYVVMLRGVNVSGHNPLKMNELVEVLVSTGFKNVRTYLQSENIVLESRLMKASAVETKIIEMLKKHFKLGLPALIRILTEINKFLIIKFFLKE